MKAYKIVRMQMMVVALGAAALLSGPARAQQSVPTRSDVNAPAAQRVEPSKSAETQPVALESSALTEEEAAAAGFTMGDGLLLLILLAGTGSIFVYAKLATRRERYLQPIRSRSRYGAVSGATTR